MTISIFFQKNKETHETIKTAFLHKILFCHAYPRNLKKVLKTKKYIYRYIQTHGERRHRAN